MCKMSLCTICLLSTCLGVLIACNAFSIPNASAIFSRHKINGKSCPSSMREGSLSRAILSNDIDKDPSLADVEANDGLESFQAKACEIASSFTATEYSPALFSRNNHFQTIVGAFFRNRPRFTYWTSDILSTMSSLAEENETGYGLSYWDVRERVETPDKDFFHVDHKYVDSLENNGSRGTVVLLHGFESDSSSLLVLDMARSYISNGFDVSCINFRGCSGEINLQPGAYHLGFTDDLKLLLCNMKEKNEKKEIKKPIYLSGFSLGANALLKLLGELGEAAPEEYNIKGAAVTSVPFDLILSGPMLATPGINKSIYTKNFLKSLKEKARKKYEAKFLESVETSSSFPFDYEGVMAATTISEVEDAYIAPLYDFDDHIDYYSKVMSANFVGGIAVPVLAINAKDDPFFHPDMIPPKVKPLRFIRTEHGGHCGFMFHQHDSSDQRSLPPTSWMPFELARFIDYVDNYET